ncbi:TIGR02266 family protein [Deltaproteobacteria bacterium]|nr:TIGR02266 family protein [Deltaproteobacteria bacterium]
MIDRVTDFSVRCEPRIPKTLSVSYKDKKSFLKAYTGNISGGGIFIKTGSPLPEGEIFFLKLMLPDLSEPLKIKCTVAWVNEKKEGETGRPQGMGLKFGEMSIKDNETLKSYIQSLTKS